MPDQPTIPSPRFPKARLLEIVRTISRVQTVWVTDRQPMLGLRPGTEHAWIKLGIQSPVGAGVDELRLKYNPTTNRNDELLIGQRRFTMTVRAESLDNSIEAFDLCERVRFRLRTKAARRLMVPTIALRDILPTHTLPDETVTDGQVQRTILVATMDVRMLCVLAADPNQPGDGGNYIETAEVAPAVISDGSNGGNLLP